MSTILIAYERDSEAAMISELLVGRGHLVVRSANGIEALDLARRDPPDLMLSDILLPKMDGFALCRKWKQDPRLQVIPFIFFTTRHDDPKYERFAEELRADRFLARPSEPDALVKAVDDLLAQARASGTGTERLPVLDEANVRLSARVLELQAENRQLADSEAAFRNLFAASPAPQWITDLETRRHVLVNDTALDLLGYSRDEFLATAPEALDPPAGAPDLPDGMHMVRRKDGHPLVLLRDNRTVTYRGRSVEASVACDLTEQAERIEELDRALNLLKAVQEASPEGFLLIDAKDKVVDANPAYCRFSGFSKKELLKRSLADLEAKAEPEAGTPTRHRDKSGNLHEVEISVRELAGHEGLKAVFVRALPRQGGDFEKQALQTRQLDALLALQRFPEDIDDHALVQRGVELAATLTESPFAAMLNLSADGKEAAVIARYQSGSTQQDRVPERYATLGRSGPWPQVVKSGESALANSAKGRPAIEGIPELERCVIIPLAEGRETRGLLVVGNRASDYNDADKEGLAGFAERLWAMFRAKRVHLHAMRELQRAEIARETLVMALVRVLDVHDPHAEGSATRVAALAVAISRELGIEGSREEGLRLAALLHDIGHVQLPAALLGKPSALNPQEMALVKTHPEAAMRILGSIDFRMPVAEIIGQHHERFDGTGYPARLKGENILRDARILAVADVVEAMCSNRAYRPAPGIDAALEEIGRQSGKGFDPEVVAACTRLFRQHGFRFPTR
jgi:PAS domain S-box-containing protein/putative nucleotidyltransferase with HDIG domain